MYGVISDLNMHEIRPSLFNIRGRPQEVNGLADSIRQKGLLQSIIVRTSKGNDYFEIVAGYRRYLAYKTLGWKKISCLYILNQ
jgi:ParB family transcriptional regulator, chromosome partitioning protein